MSANAYKYKGYTPEGRKVEGEVLAATLEEAERRAAAQNVIVISLLPSKGGDKGGAKIGEGITLKGVSDGDGAAILKNLGVMVEAGVPFLEALDSIVSSADEPAKGLLMSVRNQVVEGRSISQVLRAHPKLFPSLVADMVQVAEDGGRLDEALISSSSYLQKGAELRKKIFNAMVYPIVMLTVSFMTVVILVVFVMPRFAKIFKTMKVDLPITTRLLLSFGELIRNNPISVCVAMIGSIIGLIIFFKNSVTRALFKKLMANTPLIGDMMKRIALSRAMMSMSTLLKANVSLMTALEHGANMASHGKVGGALTRARTLVEQGGSLSDSLEESKVFPSMLIQMIRVGERTGRLHVLLAAGSERLEEEADMKLKTLVALVEPVMIVLMGIIVGTITVSIISPIYSVVQKVR